MITLNGPIYLNDINKWIISVVNDDGHIIKEKQFDDEESANIWKEKEKKKILREKEKKDMLSLENIALESGEDFQDIEALSELSQEDIDKKLEEHRDTFEQTEKECRDKAIKLLKSVAKMYMDVDELADDDYVMKRLDIESMTLSSMIFQLDLSKKALFKLSEKIHMDEASPRHFEVMTGLQRIILDISKYQTEYIQTIQEVLRDHSELNNLSSGDNTNNNDMANLNDKELTMLLEEKYKEVINDIEVTKSVNTKLENLNKPWFKDPENKNMMGDEDDTTDIDNTMYDEDEWSDED